MSGDDFLKNKPIKRWLAGSLVTALYSPGGPLPNRSNNTSQVVHT